MKYANGGKAKPFSGKDTKAEERAEAQQVRSGKVSPAQYKAKEMREEKAEGEASDPKQLMATGKAIASGRMSPDQYASQANMANGGLVSFHADMAGNHCGPNSSPRDYKK
ncbi:hypothetical protein UFOVP236_51 [uncultured Caudovirales phage]|uniref:Uncharacterized protein n=1 Tax=uncultured Caudovirales phage TaxID=2100421 RepID=A0A6J7WR78_9CAUD|nr:hypothetical protein UFOVP236_51 [uncultured Caudovirales phage]